MPLLSIHYGLHKIIRSNEFHCCVPHAGYCARLRVKNHVCACFYSGLSMYLSETAGIWGSAFTILLNRVVDVENETDSWCELVRRELGKIYANARTEVVCNVN